MTKEELITELKRANKNLDTECAHLKADDLLIEYIGDEDIKKAYGKVEKWYA